jgi:Caspase domain
MFTNNGYALLIGVDDYAAFDASSARPAGTSNLPGSRNDVKLWWQLCRQIGMKPEHIHVLASPPIPASELEGAIPSHLGSATAAEILEKAAWLGRMMAGGSQPTGLLTYSGHGDWVPGKGLALCPTDAALGANEQLVHTVSFKELNDRLAAQADNLTVVLDTCHSGPDPRAPAVNGTGTGRALTLTGRPLANLSGVRQQGTAPELVELAGRVLAAARRDQVAYQVRVDGEYHGVFSWALANAIAQWHPVQQGENVRFDVSYGTAVETAARLISALYFDQMPEVHGVAGLASLALLRQGLDGQPGETVAVPDRTVVPAQIDPGVDDYVIYTITNVDGTQLGQLLVTATANADLGFQANTEYWYITTNWNNSTTVTFTGGPSMSWSSPPSGLGLLSFATLRSTTWSYGYMAGTLPLNYNATSGTVVGLRWNMGWNGSVWAGTVTWFHNTASNVLGPGTVWELPPTAHNSYQYYITNSPI